MRYDVIVIGAGASGLAAAIAAARQGSSVLVIEQKEKAGKKILATGNGKCNFTNMVQKPECYRSDDSAFAMEVLSCFDIKHTLKFFEELGIYPRNRDGYLYPNSEQAGSVVQVLLMECERLKVEFHFQEKVKAIIKPFYTVVTETGEEDKVKQNNNASKAFPVKNTDSNKKKGKQPPDNESVKTEHTYYGSRVIIAAGGCASPQLGSDGSGYKLAESFGHTIIKPLPALVQLKSPDKYCRTVSGVRTGAKAAVYAGQRLLGEETGEILFTDYGISGIPVLQLSRFAAKELDRGKQVHLLLDFMPELAREELTQVLWQRIKRKEGRNTEEMLVGLLNNKLSYIIIKEAGLDVQKNVKQITEQEIEKLVHGMKEFVMHISGTNSFENAQVSAGGVSTGELQVPTLQSKLAKGLYLAGELVDVDGTCGGYNLQWAWSSGYLAGTAAGRKQAAYD